MVVTFRLVETLSQNGRSRMQPLPPASLSGSLASRRVGQPSPELRAEIQLSFTDTPDAHRETSTPADRLTDRVRPATRDDVERQRFANPLGVQ